jgi:hypothetical protein
MAKGAGSKAADAAAARRTVIKKKAAEKTEPARGKAAPTTGRSGRGGPAQRRAQGEAGAAARRATAS